MKKKLNFVVQCNRTTKPPINECR